MYIETWREVLSSSFQNLWMGVIDIIPKLIIAIIILIIGWAIGSLVGRVVAHIIATIKLDNLLKSARIDEVLNRAGFDLDSGRFIGALVEWFIIIAFLVASLDVLGLSQVNAFLAEVLGYIPQVIVAVLVLAAAAIIAEVLKNFVVASVRAAGLTHATLAGTVAKWSVWVFGILAALYHLNIATPFIQTLFTGIIVAISLALGLSFGLGGQDAAARYIERVRDEIAHKAK